MFDFDKFENQYLYRIKSGVDDNHMFVATATKDNGATIAIQEWCNGPTVEETIQKKSITKKITKEPQWDSKATWLLRMQELEGIPAIGVQDIKWIELYDKWGPLIPEDKRKQMKWYHENPGDARREKVKNNRNASKAAKAARTITANGAGAT
ncbi:unknown protein [Seminavis robusta]|uniref:Uncharacterized protein n=1 Tax=Seminavis robusta TaxID=568900 RepID=A0A9N8H832_9STRA|nr:unknown protein [Seminavis robusta]|eukprot:Sro225_g091731.1  (152) ;mRNA; r:21627-22082